MLGGRWRKDRASSKRHTSACFFGCRLTFFFPLCFTAYEAATGTCACRAEAPHCLPVNCHVPCIYKCLLDSLPDFDNVCALLNGISTHTAYKLHFRKIVTSGNTGGKKERKNNTHTQKEPHLLFVQNPFYEGLDWLCASHKVEGARWMMRSNFTAPFLQFQKQCRADKSS